MNNVVRFPFGVSRRASARKGRRSKNGTPKASKKKTALPIKKQMTDVEAKRAKAYFNMESHVCDLVSMGTLAMDQFDKNEGLFIFAVGKLEDMLKEFRANYYAEEFPR